ncbi:cache domain-containing protein [Sunxiuqinia sp. A32]|uniref:cache domain-containing protein n=1 Tax=Sunxiuqinia sp. A32 TaxID=3461496 RepID=UPI0040458C2F
MKNSHLQKAYKVNSISSYIKLLVIVSTVLTTIVIAVAYSAHEITTFKRINEDLKQSYLSEQKEFIKDLIDGEVQYIQEQKSHFDIKTRERFRQNVLNACKLAENLYTEYNDKLTTPELKKLIINALSSLEPQNKFSKIFINTTSGYGVYYAGRPEYSGINLTDLEDINGNRVVQAEVDFLKSNDEGFLAYSPNANFDSIPQQKVTFVKKFGHFNWYIGSKGYLEDYYNDFKLQIASKTSSMRFRHGGYIFLNETDGDPIAMNGQIFSGSFNFYDGSDLKKKEIFELQTNTAKSNYPDGGYFTYEWKKIDGSAPSPKISYVKLFKPCNWFVGAGYYLDEIDSVLAIQQKNLKKALIEDLLQIILILILILSIQFYVILRFNKKYTADFSHFNHFFTIGKGKYKTIETNDLNFNEFKQMGTIANEMINEQEKTHKKLLKEQKKAQESDRLKTAFLANMSHEIRTPMNAILGFSELINDPSLNCDSKKDFTQIIIDNGQHLLGLINDIIDISKIESDQLNISKRKFRLDSLIETIEKQFQEQLNKDGNSAIKFDVKTKIPVNYLLNSDEFRIKQVLVNLIGNAIKFTHRGSIKLNVTKTENKIRFEISDTGIGISKEDQETIFQRFVQAKINTKNNYGGTGLGLAISKNIVNILGGEIGVTSKPGKGSEFYFYIPI